jgi:ABC-type multidrug transport system, ATPase and permease components
LYLVAAFRLIPAIMRILSIMQSIKGLQASVDMLNNELEYYENNKKENFKNTFNEKISLNKNIKFKNVYFSYDQKKEILKDFSFEINKSEIIGIYGKSGFGKSTLVDLLTGLLTPNKGEILIDEKFKLNQNNIPEWQKKIGYVSQNIFLFDTTLRQNIAFGVKEELIDDNKIFDVLKYAELYDFVSKLDKKLDTQVGEKGIKFSGGQVQRMGIARELYRDPELLILDEATNSLDKQTENLILESIKDLKKSTTIIIISHKESTLKIG